ncbi:MAG: hypothetical protein LBG62_06560 [Candidatus Methanoplasma sp.]|jgi:hypothetical protein|nr:hypothetical protein [Candidatus Methanoplasma sp.]
MLDEFEESGFMKIYCLCGRIVDLDRASAEMKFRLRKGAECAICRNSRISREIDEIETCFNGSAAESD